MQTIETLGRGREAFDRHEWAEAHRQLGLADGAAALGPEDLERLATAAYLTGRDAESTEAWARAHRDWLASGQHRRAVRCAFWLGFGLVQRGDLAQGSGWLARADRLVAEHGLDSVEQGYLLVPSALRAMGEGQVETALARFGEADAVGRRFGDPDLVTIGVLGRGQAMLSLGRTPEGLRQLDEAMVAVTAGETSPTVSGLVYCAVIDACHRVFDLRRAGEWTAALDRWCSRQPGLVPYRGQCLVHRAQVLQARGEWDASAAEAEQALQWLSTPPHPALGMAHYQRAELHRLRGEAAEAEAAYRRAHAAGRDPQPGLALLRLDEGAVEAAAVAIASAVEHAGDRLVRTRLLPAYAEVMLAAGRLDEAAAAADELDSLGGDGATMLGAVAARTHGALLLARDDPASAVGCLTDALEAWQQLGDPYETARLRGLLAEACRRLHDDDRARLELDAAREALAALGAGPALALLAPSPAGELFGELTEREVQVLRHVADGRTNREIAGELALSEKTVERHLGNLFSKLGAANRAAATAIAYRHGLL